MQKQINIDCPNATVTSLMYVRTKKMYLQRTHERTPATEWNSFTLFVHARINCPSKLKVVDSSV